MPESDLPAIERAALHLYRIFDISNSIDIERGRTLLAAPSARVRPVVSRGGNIEIPQLPLELSLGEASLVLAGKQFSAQLYARIYDLGILAFRLVIALPEALTWDDATDLLASAQSYPEPVKDIFTHGLDTLRTTLAAAMRRPNATVRDEEYAILVVERLGLGEPASRLARRPELLRSALGERRPLSESAGSLATTLSYYADDLMLLTWTAAVVIEPEAEARDDATLLLEFANVQLLALRTFDAEVDRELAAVAPAVAAHARGPVWIRLRSSRRFLRELNGLIFDITDTSARIENALKVSEDVYWNRVYAAALQVLRVQVWRAGIDEALSVLRQMATALHDEAYTSYTNLLEVLVIVLIAVEIVVAVVERR
jgi:hypothetical protein